MPIDVAAFGRGSRVGKPTTAVSRHQLLTAVAAARGSEFVA